MIAGTDLGQWTALVLAGSRGPSDPVAAHCGVAHKAFAPVAGVPMIVRVLRNLAASRHVRGIVLCADSLDPFLALPEIDALVHQGHLGWKPTAGSPSLSVENALRLIPEPFPLLVTTADHPLLTAEMIDHFCNNVPADADAAVALAPASLIRRAHPGAVRTFYRVGNEAYSGCNLFAFRRPQAVRVAAFWAEMERHRKRPGRLIAAVGPLTLLRFLTGLLDLRHAETLLSRRTGAAIRIVEMPFAEAAIDVDKPVDLALAEEILRHRA